MNSSERVIMLVDGFNLYHSIARHRELRQYKWLDLVKLAQNILNKRQTLVEVFFFTAYYPNDPKKEQRHRLYVSALESKGVRTVLGKFRRKDKYCSLCKGTSVGWEEKETDVNIAIGLLKQAHQDRYDAAFLLSADSDMIPSINAVKDAFPEKHVKVVLPPNAGGCNVLREAADSNMRLKARHLKAAQFPDVLETSSITIEKPASWS